MIRISKRMFYAVDAVLFIALNQTDSGTISSRRLAQAQNVSARYMEHTLQRLVRRGILEGTRGPRGGYRLARAPEHVTIGDILATVDNPSGSPTGEVAGSPAGQAVLLPLFDSLVQETLERLDRITLADLMTRTRTMTAVSRSMAPRRDMAIA